MACDLPASPPIREVDKRDLTVLDGFEMMMENGKWKAGWRVGRSGNGFERETCRVHTASVFDDGRMSLKFFCNR
jgi:hypothetical protein